MPYRDLPDSDDSRNIAMVQGIGAYKVYVTDQPDEAKKIKAITRRPSHTACTDC